jgi:hypothetical protein
MVSPGKRRGKARKRAGGTAGVAVVVSGRDRKPGARGAVKATPKAVPVMGMDGTLPVPSSRPADEISRERLVAPRAEPIGRAVKALPVGASRNGGLARESAGTEGVRAGSAVGAGSPPGFEGQLSGRARGSVRAGGGRAGGRAGVTRLDPGVVAAGAASRGTEVPALPVPIASFLI